MKESAARPIKVSPRDFPSGSTHSSKKHRLLLHESSSTIKPANGRVQVIVYIANEHIEEAAVTEKHSRCRQTSYMTLMGSGLAICYVPTYTTFILLNNHSTINILHISAPNCIVSISNIWLKLWVNTFHDNILLSANC